MELKRMSDYELARKILNYIDRIEKLLDVIADFLDCSQYDNVLEEYIKDNYKQLKNEIRKDAAYLNLVRNRNGSDLYKYIFMPSICEASAWGFTLPSNSRISQQMYSAVSDAQYKLTKYYTREQWNELI